MGATGPAVKPIALSMVSEIARAPEYSGRWHWVATTQRDAAKYNTLGGGNVQVCTAAMTQGSKLSKRRFGPFAVDG
jgi:dihydropyrimidine dehydrogenase (NAD+) subunit PreA